MKTIKILGTGCANCKNTIALIDQVAKAKGVEVQLQKVEELRDIMGYGVLSTPGVVINGKVVHAGGVPTRNSTMMDADMVRQYPEYITLRQQLEYSDPDWRPIIAEWDEINIQALGVAVSEALTGKKTPEDALNGIVPKVSDIMKRGGYLKA